MLVKGVAVHRTRAEEARRVLSSSSAVDTSRAIIEEDGLVIIPLTVSPNQEFLRSFEAMLVEREFPPRPFRNDPIIDIRNSASIPERLRGLIPDKWELLGDVLFIRLPHSLDDHEEEVARAYASVLHAKSVLRDEGGVRGALRTPVVRLLLGTDTVTTHVENGVTYKFDALRIMFSSGNIDERIRIAGIRCDDELVVDMFAGIGYFSLPLSVHQKPKRVVACELNPVSYGYLVENIRVNGVEDIVEPVLGDNRDLPGDSVADRVFMGYVKTTHEYLDTAFRLLRSGGMIHYHETCPCELLPGRPIERLKAALPEGHVEIMDMREIKSYAPGVSHVVVDAKVVKRV